MKHTSDSFKIVKSQTFIFFVFIITISRCLLRQYYKLSLYTKLDSYK